VLPCPDCRSNRAVWFGYDKSSYQTNTNTYLGLTGGRDWQYYGCYHKDLKAAINGDDVDDAILSSM
jgi:hypothetical protein